MDCGGKMDCGGQGPHVGLPEPLPAQPRPSREELGGAWSCFPPLGLFLGNVANWGLARLAVALEGVWECVEVPT